MRNRPLRALCLALSIACLALPAGCRPALEEFSGVGFYFDTVVTISIYGESRAPVDEALSRCAQYEALLSKTLEGSDVWRVNHAQGSPVEVSEDTRRVLECALDISARSGGAFDVTIAPAADLWDFTGDEPALPAPAALAAAAARVDYTQVVLQGDTVTLPAGMELDLGGIAKGYIADEIAAFLRVQGIAHGVLNFGGNVVVIGTKADGTPWNIGIQDPAAATGAYLGSVPLENASAVTSGIYQRCFTRDGVLYHHVLDPATGYPVENELASVTILSPDSMLGDALSTACLVLGVEAAQVLLETFPGVEAVFVGRDGTLAHTPGLDGFLPMDATA